jgi:phosphate transport system substrate-binding protein
LDAFTAKFALGNFSDLRPYTQNYAGQKQAAVPCGSTGFRIVSRLTPALWAFALLSAWFAPCASAAGISGAGSTFAYPIYALWAQNYEKETGIRLNYQSIGSSAGVEAITARTVTFGASDAPLSAKQLADGGNLIQWPMVMGGIVPVINLEGVAPNEMTLDGDTLAKIFLGEITAWDDPALKTLNPNLNLPSAAIVVVHRSDRSGTTFNFTAYLSKVNAAWGTKVGSEMAAEWPAGIGAKGSQGVASTVQQTMGSIGYVETAYAKQNTLITAKMINKAGKAVEATSASVRAAADNWWSSSLDWARGDGISLIFTDEPGEEAWPISASTFILMPAAVKDAQEAKQALDFFAWAYAHGDQAAAELDYAPMPVSLKRLAIQKWGAIKGPDGKPVYAGN